LGRTSSAGLSRLPKETGIAINTVILAGSVLKENFPWRDLIGTRVARVVNDCGLNDKVLLLSKLLVLFTGMAGRVGFTGATSRIFRNRYSPFGHSGYFQDRNGNRSRVPHPRNYCEHKQFIRRLGWNRLPLGPELIPAARVMAVILAGPLVREELRPAVRICNTDGD
jgi:hypothetical protein